MRIKYTPAAVDDILSTADYIEKTLKNTSAAEAFKARILHSISLLKDSPNMGVKLSEKIDWFKNDYKYIVVKNHLVFYRISEEVIIIVRILDGRTDYPSLLEDFELESEKNNQ